MIAWRGRLGYLYSRVATAPTCAYVVAMKYVTSELFWTIKARPTDP